MSVRHGTVTGYQYYGCRCPDCRAVNADSQRRNRVLRTARLAEDPSLARHGLGSTYRNWGCRCPECTAANTADSARWRKS